jgi:hypothetical protein
MTKPLTIASSARTISLADAVAAGLGQLFEQLPAPVISVVLPVKAVATAASFICRVTGNAGEVPPFVRENKGHIPNGRRLTASARILRSRICMNAPR